MFNFSVPEILFFPCPQMGGMSGNTMAMTGTGTAMTMAGNGMPGNGMPGNGMPGNGMGNMAGSGMANMAGNGMSMAGNGMSMGGNGMSMHGNGMSGMAGNVMNMQGEIFYASYVYYEVISVANSGNIFDRLLYLPLNSQLASTVCPKKEYTAQNRYIIQTTNDRAMK